MLISLFSDPVEDGSDGSCRVLGYSSRLGRRLEYSLPLDHVRVTSSASRRAGSNAKAAICMAMTAFMARLISEILYRALCRAPPGGRAEIAQHGIIARLVRVLHRHDGGFDEGDELNGLHLSAHHSKRSFRLLQNKVTLCQVWKGISLFLSVHV